VELGEGRRAGRVWTQLRRRLRRSDGSTTAMSVRTSAGFRGRGVLGSEEAEHVLFHARTRARSRRQRPKASSPSACATPSGPRGRPDALPPPRASLRQPAAAPGPTLDRGARQLANRCSCPPRFGCSSPRPQAAKTRGRHHSTRQPAPALSLYPLGRRQRSTGGCRVPAATRLAGRGQACWLRAAVEVGWRPPPPGARGRAAEAALDELTRRGPGTSEPASLDASRRRQGGLGRSGLWGGGRRRRASSLAELRRAGLESSVREERRERGGDKVKRRQGQNGHKS
jgi:hypothetical protein